MLLWFTPHEPTHQTPTHTHHVNADGFNEVAIASVCNTEPAASQGARPTRPAREPARTAVQATTNTSRVDTASKSRARETQPAPQHACTPWLYHVHHHETINRTDTCTATWRHDGRAQTRDSPREPRRLTTTHKMRGIKKCTAREKT